MRQYSHHYPIRAGRNLPDKEFRYLRTVIVTAAVHQGLKSSLARITLTFWHWAGVSPYTSSYDLAETCVFGKQLHEFFRCALHLLNKIKSAGRPYPEVTAAVLPSSLSLVISFTLVYSTHPPVSVFGTEQYIPRYEDFLGR